MVPQIKVDDIAIEVILKDIKNVHLRVYPPTGRVRISAPKRMSIDTIRVFATSRLDWIKRQQTKIAARPRQIRREMVSCESHYVQGVRYRLDVIEGGDRPSVSLRNGRTLEMRMRPGTGRKDREAALHHWYRRLLRDQIPDLLAKWEPIVGVKVAEWRIRKVKTRWGSCNITARRIWLNLELAKKPKSCLEYIVVHELVHILERRHNDQFKGYMDRFMPRWRLYQNELNATPPSDEAWMP